jgi:hypothetical protein
MPLIIMRDPDGITGIERHEFDASVSLQENIARALPGGGADCELRIDGAVVDPLTDLRLDAPPADGMHVVVIRRPAASAIKSVFRFVGSVVGAVLKPLGFSRQPSSSANGAFTGKDSPNNSLTAQTNIARAYQGVPDVYGYRRCWPDLIQPSVIEYVDQVKLVTELLCVSRGKGTITAVQYAETPIADIDGSSVAIFEPTPAGGYPEFGSTTVTDVIETFSSADVNGQELPYAISYPPVSRTGSFVMTGSATFTVEISDGSDLDNLKSLVPSGTARIQSTIVEDFDRVCTVSSFVDAGATVTFTFVATSGVGPITDSAPVTITPIGATTTSVGPITLPISGGQIWWNTVFLRGLRGSVVVKAEWWQIDGAGAEIGGTRQSQNNTYTASTYDQRYYTTKVTPSAGVGRYRVEFTRLSIQVDSEGADVAKVEGVFAVRYYATKTFPACTIIRVQTKATLSATGSSERKFNLRWARHVRTLTADTLSASRNFARALLHIWTIAGNSPSEIDTDALLAINAEHGETSELLRYDGSLDDSDKSLGERMQEIAYTARCVVWRDGTQWTVVRDQARTLPELQLDYRNLAASGESAISYASHLPKGNDGVEVEFVDEASQSKRAYVRLVIVSGAPAAGTPANALKVKLPGCTTLTQATSRAQLEARRLLFQRITVADTALADALALGPLSLVRWIDPADFAGDDGLQAGEVLAIAGSTITTSEPLDFKGATSGRIMLTGINGGNLGAPIVCTPGPTAASVVLASVPAGLYAPGGARQLGSRYAFAVGLTQAEVEAAGLYTVTEIRPGADGTASLACVNYDPRLYAAD